MNYELFQLEEFCMKYFQFVLHHCNFSGCFVTLFDAAS